MINIMFVGGFELNVDYPYEDIEAWIRSNPLVKYIVFPSDEKLIISKEHILWIKEVK